MIRLFCLSVLVLVCGLTYIPSVMSADGNPSLRASGFSQSRGNVNETSNFSQSPQRDYRTETPGQTAGARSGQFAQRMVPAATQGTQPGTLTGRKLSAPANPITPVDRQKQPSQSNAKSSAARSAPSIWGTLGALLVVISIILVTAKLFKKHNPLAATSLPREVMEVLGKKPLDARQTIHFVRCGSRILILGSSPAGLEMLSEVLDPVEVDLITGMCRERAQAGRSNTTFLNLFQTAQNKQGQNERPQADDRVRPTLNPKPDQPLRVAEPEEFPDYDSAVTRLQQKLMHSSRQSLIEDAESGHV